MGAGEYSCLRNPIADLEAFSSEDHSASPVGELRSSSGYYGETKQGIGAPERNRILGLK